MFNNDIPICPNCGNEVAFYLDEWGRTPFHLHCNFCNINIGATKVEKCIKLFNKYNKKDTYIEYYNKKIQVLFEDNKACKISIE